MSKRRERREAAACEHRHVLGLAEWKGVFSSCFRFQASQSGAQFHHHCHHRSTTPSHHHHHHHPTAGVAGEAAREAGERHPKAEENKEVL